METIDIVELLALIKSKADCNKTICYMRTGPKFRIRFMFNRIYYDETDEGIYFEDGNNNHLFIRPDAIQQVLKSTEEFCIALVISVNERDLISLYYYDERNE